MKAVEIQPVEYIETDEWIDCWQCGGAAFYHDCMDDTCCCLDPEEDTPCSECKGEGGWHRLEEKRGTTSNG